MASRLRFDWQVAKIFKIFFKIFMSYATFGGIEDVRESTRWIVSVCILSGLSLGWIATFPTEKGCAELQFNPDDAVTNQLERVYFFVDSLLGSGTIIGWTIAGVFIDQYGVHWGVQSGSVAALIGWFFIGTSSNLAWMTQSELILLAGRFITGVSIGLSSIALPIYLVEAAPDHPFVLLLPLSAWIGSSSCYLIGPSPFIAMIFPSLVLYLLERIKPTPCFRTFNDKRWIFNGILLLIFKALGESSLLVLIEKSLTTPIILFATDWTASMPLLLWLNPGWSGLSWIHLCPVLGYMLSFILLGSRNAFLTGSMLLILSSNALLFINHPAILGLNIVGFCASLAVMPIAILPRVFSSSSRVSILCLMLLLEWGSRQYIIDPLKDIQREMDWDRILLIEILAGSFGFMLTLLFQFDASLWTSYAR